MFRIPWHTFGGKITQKYLFITLSPIANHVVKLTSCCGFCWILILLEMDGNNKFNVNYTQICTYSRHVVSYTLGRGWKYTKQSPRMQPQLLFSKIMYTVQEAEENQSTFIKSCRGGGFWARVVCPISNMRAWAHVCMRAVPPHPRSRQEKKTSFGGDHRRSHIKEKRGASKEVPHIWSDWRAVCGGPEINERPEV